MNIVQSNKKNELLVRTIDIYDKLGYKSHEAMKKVLFKNKDSFLKYGELVEERIKTVSRTVDTETSKDKGGRPNSSYLLNENHFLLLCVLSKNNPKIAIIKMAITDEFIAMRKKLAEYHTESLDYAKNRYVGIGIHNKSREVVKEFIDYAKNQGASKGADFYYANIATMENKALFIFNKKYPNMREVLNIQQLVHIATADSIIEKTLAKGMDNGLNYKDIYQNCKTEIVKFSEIIGQSKILELPYFEK